MRCRTWGDQPQSQHPEGMSIVSEPDQRSRAQQAQPSAWGAAPFHLPCSEFPKSLSTSYRLQPGSCFSPSESPPLVLCSCLGFTLHGALPQVPASCLTPAAPPRWWVHGRDGAPETTDASSSWGLEHNPQELGQQNWSLLASRNLLAAQGHPLCWAFPERGACMRAGRSLLHSWRVCMWWSWRAHVQPSSRQSILS